MSDKENNEELFGDVKEGDSIYVFGSYGSGLLKLQVVGVTPTRFATGTNGKTYFFKSNGKEVGGDKWHTMFAMKPTPELNSQYNMQRLQSQLMTLGGIKVTKENYGELRAAVDVLLKFKPKAEKP